MIQKKEDINALLSLLDEPDNEIYDQVEKEILSLGSSVSIHLAELESQTKNEIIKKRTKKLVQKIKYNQCISELKAWVLQDNHYSWDFIYILSEFCDSSFDKKEVTKTIDNLFAEFYEKHPDATSTNIIGLLAKFIFEDLKYEFDFHPFSIENLLISSFLKQKKGSSFLFTMLFSILGQSRHQYVLPVTFPQNIVLALAEPDLKTKEWSVISYINPANGEPFSRSGIELFLRKNNIEIKSYFFSPCSTIKLAYMYAKQLSAAHKEIGNVRVAEQLNQIIKVIFEQ